MTHLGPVRLFYSAILLLTAFSTGCGSSTNIVTPTGPSIQRCAVTLSVNTSGITSAGGSGTITVATARECQWTARSESDWLVFSGPPTGQGAADLAFSVQPNRSTSQRSVEVSIADQRVTISQQAATCSWSVSPNEVAMGPAGGDRTVRLSTEDFCSWTASSNESWVVVASASSGKGSADIILRIARNDGPERTSTVELPAGKVSVRQREALAPPAVPPPPANEPPAPAPTPPPSTPPPAAPCTFQVAPAVFNDVPFSGSPLQVEVTTQAGCAWSAVSNAAWLNLSSGANGTGSGRVQLAVAENAGPARSGTLAIAGQTVTVNQQSRPCEYAISPSSYSPTSAGGSVSVTVTTAAGCEWTVAGSPAWVSASSAGSTGSGTTTITVQSNTGAARSSTFKIAGRDFIVQQASAPCTYAAGPTTRTIPAWPTTTREIGVFTQAHCPVSATESASWLEILSAPTLGSGEILFRILENPGKERSAPITITGENFVHTVTIIQEAKE